MVNKSTDETYKNLLSFEKGVTRSEPLITKSFARLPTNQRICLTFHAAVLCFVTCRELEATIQFRFRCKTENATPILDIPLAIFPLEITDKMHTLKCNISQLFCMEISGLKSHRSKETHAMGAGFSTT